MPTERKRRDRRKMNGEYEVGYGKPPKEHRFQAGRSGNVQPAIPHGQQPRRLVRVQIEFHQKKLVFWGHTVSPLAGHAHILRVHHPKVPCAANRDQGTRRHPCG